MVLDLRLIEEPNLSNIMVIDLKVKKIFFNIVAAINFFRKMRIESCEFLKYRYIKKSLVAKMNLKLLRKNCFFFFNYSKSIFMADKERL